MNDKQKMAKALELIENLEGVIYELCNTMGKDNDEARTELFSALDHVMDSRNRLREAMRVSGMYSVCGD